MMTILSWINKDYYGKDYYYSYQLKHTYFSLKFQVLGEEIKNLFSPWAESGN